MKTILRGEIWRVRFDPTEGSEIGKTRPALVLQNDLGNRYANTTIVAAITGRIKDLPTLVDVNPSKSNGLRQPCAINLSHIRTVSQSRLTTRIGRLEDIYFPQIELAMLLSCGFLH
jgi:mRNA interferase MazF